MNICAEIIRDRLAIDSRLHNPGEGMPISRHAFLTRPDSLRAGTLYLASAESLPAGLELSGGSALLCAGKVPEDLLVAGFPVLEVSADADLSELSNEVDAIFESYRELELHLHAALRYGCKMQDLVDIMAPFFQNSLTVCDSNHQMLAASTYDVFSMGPGNMTPDGIVLPFEVINFFKSNKRWIDARRFREPFIYNEGIFEYRLLCLNIIEDSDFVCRVMVAELYNPFRAYDVELLRFFTEFVATLFLRGGSFGGKYGADALEDMLRMTLSGADVGPQRIEQALAAGGHKDGSGYLCVSIHPSDGDYTGNTLSYYCGQIGRQFSGTTAFEFHGDIICFVDIGAFGGGFESFVKSITPYVRDNNFRAGIGAQFNDLSRFADCHAQSRIALNFGIAHNPSKWIHRFEEYAVDYMLELAAEKSDARTLCDARILALYEYDLKNGTDYVGTVEAYFRNNQNALQTARELHIHRATMIYRLKRVEELSGLVFENAQLNLYCQLSIRLLRGGEQI